MAVKEEPGEPEPSASDAVVVEKADFIDDVATWLQARRQSPEQAMRILTESIETLKTAELKLVQQKQRMLGKIPEIKAAMDMVKMLIEKEEEGGEAMKVDFELVKHVYSQAEITDHKKVYLWLGADTMVEYGVEEAKALLEQNLKNAETTLASADKQLLYVRDNITTTEVSIARVYNYDVEKRRMDMLNADIDAVKVAAA